HFFITVHAAVNGQTTLLGFVPHIKPYLGIDKLEVKFEDGYIYCKFLRNGRIAHNGQSFDISGINYHIMLAAGPAEQGLIHEHWEYAVSSEKVDLDDYGKVNARDVQGLITCHGILMTIAWMLIVPVTTLLPRHKQSWNGKKLFSLPPWFALHRLLAIVAVALTACSFIIIFIAKGGWVNVEDQLANSHAVLGVIITVLAILQPLGSMLRPAPDHPKRWLFNVIHACTGYLLFILGNVYEGCGSSKGCYGAPSNCELSKTCSVLTTYKKVDEDSFEFEVYGALSSLDSGYIAVGMSFDDSMGQDSVAECVQINGKFNLYHSYNNQYYNTRLSDTEQEGFELLDSYIENHHMYCRYKRPKVVSVDGRSFDLADNWYVLLATGKATEGNIISHFLGGSVSHSSVPMNLNQYRTSRSWHEELSLFEVYSDCGVGKGCFGIPKNCEANHSCKVLMTHRKDDSAGYEFEVLGVLNQPDNSYIAVGLSFDAVMGNDSVTECVYRDQNFKVYHSYNEPSFNNERLPELEQVGLQLLDSKLLDGYMYCKFRRDALHMNNGAEFDLTKPWYILLASSTAAADNVLSHYGYFADHTDEPVVFGDTGTSTDSATESTIISTLPNESTISPTVTQPQLLEVYNDCGTQKGCFGIPKKCETDKSCDVLMTHRKGGFDGYEFEVLGVLNQPDNSYVAVGLSFDAEM
ncbi:hypothetical protein QYM36_014491, partial [Artemia franciscana]